MNNILDDTIQRLSEETGKYYDKMLFDWATKESYFTENRPKVKITKLDRIKWVVTDFIKKTRINIAEFIGGDYLHENCGDY